MLTGIFHENGPRFSGVGESVSFEQRRDDLVVRFDFIGPLSDRRQQPVQVDIVQLVCFTRVRPDAAADHQHRDTVQKGFADTAGSVCHTGRRDDQQRAGLPGRAADGIGHERRAAFVRHQDAARPGRTGPVHRRFRYCAHRECRTCTGCRFARGRASPAMRLISSFVRLRIGRTGPLRAGRVFPCRHELVIIKLSYNT